MDVRQWIAKKVLRLEPRRYTSTSITEIDMTKWNLCKEKEERIIKKNDDSLDAFRYAVYTTYQDFYIDSPIFNTVQGDN